MDVLLLNGPNLNTLGVREPEIYGTTTLTEVEQGLTAAGEAFGLKVDCFQSNFEGALLERIHAARTDGTRFIIINPGALTHTSVALRDALLFADVPFIEVHVSNVHAREKFRHTSYLSDIAVGVITGLGVQGYSMALTYASIVLDGDASGGHVG